MPLLSPLALLFLSGAAAQRYFGGIGKNTWAVNEPADCMRFFQTYLQGVRREANECPKDTCTCSQQARVHLRNATGTTESYRPLAPYNNETFDMFGIHAVNCSHHPFGSCTLGEVEADFVSQFGRFERHHPLMDHNLGLWIDSLDPLLTKFERDGVPFLPLRWSLPSNHVPAPSPPTYFSVLARPCGTVVLEFISSNIGSRSASSFEPFPIGRMDFDLDHTHPQPPSADDPLALTPLKVSRATTKLDEVRAFYTAVFNASVLRNETLPDGARKLVLKMPDVSTGRSSVHLQFWSPPPDADVTSNLGTPGVAAQPLSRGACTGWTVGSWEAYLYGVSQSQIRSPTCGFPKSLDFHFSFDCVDEDCVLDPIAARLDRIGAPYRWTSAPIAGSSRPWWLLYATDPTGYGVETHFVRWVHTPDPGLIAPGCFGTYSNGTCPGAVQGQCT